MDINLIIVFLTIFFIFGAGGTLFWGIKKAKSQQHVQVQVKPLEKSHNIDQPNASVSRDATLSDWEKGKCKTLSGTCGKGTFKMTRNCLQEGTGDGFRCNDVPLESNANCYVQCKRPENIIDWGHPNDAEGLPAGSPKKGWYDISGQGQPNDYCRWVGDHSSRFWACHVEKDPYVRSDPAHISFSGGPANQLIPFHPSLIEKMCGKAPHLLAAQDPDLRISIANGFMSNCGARCVYDHRNPKTGWTYSNGHWLRIEDMSRHVCGTVHKNELDAAKKRYEKVYDVRNAWQ